jgi:hypothetical protein
MLAGLGGVVHRSLGDGRSVMDVRKMVVVSSRVVVAGLARSLH